MTSLEPGETGQARREKGAGEADPLEVLVHVHFVQLLGRDFLDLVVGGLGRLKLMPFEHFPVAFIPEFRFMIS